MSHNCRRPPSAIAVSACGVKASLLNFNQPWVHCCVFDAGCGGDGLDRMFTEIAGGVCQSNIQCDQGTAHWRLVGAFSGEGHQALTAACGAKPNPPFSTHPLGVLLLLTVTTQAVQSITAWPSFSPHPTTHPHLRLLLWSTAPLLSIYQHCV